MNLLEWVVIINAAFVLGITLLTFAEYARSAKIIHIAMVAGSHFILTILTTLSITSTIFATKYRGLAIIFALIAFAGTDYAVLWMLRNRYRTFYSAKGK